MGFGEGAAVVAFLLFDDAAFVIGATLPVDGGGAVRGHDPGEPADGT
jgi:hypothetical protein